MWALAVRIYTNCGVNAMALAKDIFDLAYWAFTTGFERLAWI